jgi:hypothetical protein
LKKNALPSENCCLNLSDIKGHAFSSSIDFHPLTATLAEGERS